MNTKLLAQILAVIETNIAKYAQYDELLIESRQSKTQLEDFARTVKTIKDSIKKPSETVDLDATQKVIELAIRTSNIVKAMAEIGMDAKNPLSKELDKSIDGKIVFVRSKFQSAINIRQSDLDVEANATSKKAPKKDLLENMNLVVNDIKCLKRTVEMFNGSLKNKSFVVTGIDAFSFCVLRMASFSLKANAVFLMDVLKPKNKEIFDMELKYEFDKSYKEFNTNYDVIEKQLDELDKVFTKLVKGK